MIAPLSDGFTRVWGQQLQQWARGSPCPPQWHPHCPLTAHCLLLSAHCHDGGISWERARGYVHGVGEHNYECVTNNCCTWCSENALQQHHTTVACKQRILVRQFKQSCRENFRHRSSSSTSHFTWLLPFQLRSPHECLQFFARRSRCFLFQTV